MTKSHLNDQHINYNDWRKGLDALCDLVLGKHVPRPTSVTKLWFDSGMTIYEAWGEIAATETDAANIEIITRRRF